MTYRLHIVVCIAIGWKGEDRTRFLVSTRVDGKRDDRGVVKKEGGGGIGYQ